MGDDGIRQAIGRALEQFLGPATQDIALDPHLIGDSAMKTIINKGSSFESFLDEEGILDEVDEAAVNRVIVRQVEREMAAWKLNEAQPARRVGKSRTQVDRLLDPDNGGS